MKHLGESFDLHSGGVDLVFPHHENEIAQSEAATGKTFAHHWLHIAHLTVEGRKMSKSLGNLYTLEDLAERGHTPMELRYVLISGSYRQPLNFTFDSLAAAKKSLTRLGNWQHRLGGDTEIHPPGKGDFGPFAPVLEALLNDLNTPEAIGRLHSIGRKVMAMANAEELSPAETKAASEGLSLVLRCLGLVLPNPENAPATNIDEPPASVNKLASERLEARQNRNWETADQLRDQILEAGWTVLDNPDGFSLEPLETKTEITDHQS
jgi:cysteinyl-tRNA synthetase